MWRLRMINNAKSKIVMITYMMRADHSGTDVIAALVDAAKRGVDIYILIDSVSSKIQCLQSREICYLASFKNVCFCLYNPFFFHNPFRLTFRMHDKILAIDDDVYMIGGRNVLDVSIGNYVSKFNIDRDVVVVQEPGCKEPSIHSINHYIALLQKDCAIEVFKKGIAEQYVEEVAKRMAVHHASMCEAHPMIMLDMHGTEKDVFYPSDSISLIIGDPNYRFKGLEIWSQLVRLMKSGENVLVQTPYMMCNNLMYQGISEVIKAVQSFAIITNAPEAGANFFGCADYMNQRKKIQRKGIRVYECSAGQSLHTKSIMIDNDISVIGSFNFDTRSAYMDTELMLVIHSEELNKCLRKTAQALIDKSRYADQDGNYQFGDRYVKKRMSLPLSAFYALLRIMVRPFRFLL